MVMQAPQPPGYQPASATLQDYANKGVSKYSRKMSNMKNSYAAAVERAVQNYQRTPFGPTRKQNYEQAMRTHAPQNYNPNTDWVNKWATNWVAKMSE